MSVNPAEVIALPISVSPRFPDVQLLEQPSLGDTDLFGIDVNADATPTVFQGRNQGRARSQKRFQNPIARLCKAIDKFFEHIQRLLPFVVVGICEPLPFDDVWPEFRQLVSVARIKQNGLPVVCDADTEMRVRLVFVLVSDNPAITQKL